MKINKLIYAFISIMLCLALGISGISAFATETKITDYSSIDKQIAEDIEKYHIPAMAVAVVDKDSVLFEKTYGNCESVDQPFIIGSMSKSFTAIAIMQLYEQGKINFDSPIDEYIDTSEWFEDNTDHGRITVKDLLNHTSGITTYQTFGFLKSTEQYGSYEYANANYGLLGLIIEAVSGMSYEQYIEQNIFEPIGMSHSAASLEKSKENGLIDGYRNYFGIYVAGDPDYPDKIKKGTWTNIPAGYLSSSVTDMEKYLQMYLRGGEKIVSSESIDRMFYDNVPVSYGTYYGMGWNYVTEMYSQPILMHAGLVENYTSNMFIIPEKGIAVVVLVNMNDYLVGNNLLGNIVMPLLGEPKQKLPNLYLILHAVIDVICS
ncbi:MAG: serine hydrolase, partial [Firmicutes bacterium]|nr:serine hydrolase [Bacillota bacterium]